MTSAAIPRVAPMKRKRASAARTLAAAALALAFFAVGAAGTALADVDHRARCEAAREESGLGRRAALRALDEPEAQSRFLYRVRVDGHSYRAAVVVREGPFAGDAWERDAEGRTRHLSDVCRDGAWEPT